MHRARFLSGRPIADILKLMKDQVETVVNSNGHGWRSYINNMSRMVRSDPDEFKFQLFLLQTWFQQAYRLRRNIAGPLAENGFADLGAYTKNTLMQSPLNPKIREQMIKDFEKIKAGY